MVSLTTVGAFEAVGLMLVVSFMIGLPVTAYLLTDDLKTMILLTGATGLVNGISSGDVAGCINCWRHGGHDQVHLLRGILDRAQAWADQFAAQEAYTANLVRGTDAALPPKPS